MMVMMLIAFCRFVEAAYGYWSNSLSLIADSGDCNVM
jgi:Co/Zn/Cd efflux system component